MVKYLIAISFILIITSSISGQNVVIKFQSKPEIFTVDKLGNSYVYFNNQLLKYDNTGKVLANFNQVGYGNLGSIDAADPMQILLFYKDFNQILFLDRQLAPLGKPFLFDELGFSDVTAVCKSKQMAVWFYDGFESKLVQYGFNPPKVLQSINLDYLENSPEKIGFLVENRNKLYLSGKDGKIWVFDQFGGQVNELGTKIDTEFQLISEKLVYQKKEKLLSVDLNTFNIDSVSIPGLDGHGQVKFGNRHFYVLKNDSLEIIPQTKSF